MDINKKPVEEDYANYAVRIAKLHENEIKLLDAYREETDPDFKVDWLEDAYLAHVCKVDLARRFNEDKFNEYELDKPLCVPYSELAVIEFEVYEDNI